jgi:hypothetical protein
MRPKGVRIFYYTSIIIFSLLMLLDGFGGLSQQKEGVEAMQHLGYPAYILLIMGTAKILGVIAILQNKFKVLKEWAFAGFAFNFIGAEASIALNGDGMESLIFPVVALLLLAITYMAWKKYERATSIVVA